MTGLISMRPVLTVFKFLAWWLVLSIPVALLVAQILKARSPQPTEQRERYEERLSSLSHPAVRAQQMTQAPRPLPDRHRTHRAR